MKTSITVFITLFIVFNTFPVERMQAATIADSLFDASTIPAYLLIDADAVIRYHEVDLRVDDRRRLHQTVRMIITVLNAQGRDNGKLSVYYDQFRTIRSFRGEIYDASGRRIKRLRRADIQDYSMIAGFSLYDDSRIQYAELYHSTYPYTIYFEYELRHNGYINFPDWIIQQSRTAVENTIFRVSLSQGNEIRFRNVKYDGEPLITNERNHTVYTWSETNVAAFETESYGPHITDQVMSVQITPRLFEIDGYRGDFTSWNAFGNWYYTLSKGRDKLPDAALRDVERIVNQSENEIEIVRNLFEYMQNRTRYVSVQLGIGGWQPFDAMYVHERGYGDCKALTNYMMALLTAAGIESYPVLIYSGTRPVYLDNNFAINRFNHVILSVPVDGDTVWLECTSQTIPFGHIGLGNENRKALLITPEGGVLIQTPVSSPQQNRQHRSAVVDIRPNGAVMAEVFESYTGLQQDRVRQGIANRSSRDRLNWMKRNIDLPSFNLESVDYSGVEGRAHEVTLSYNIDAPRYANRMGDRLLFPANFLERRTFVPPASDDRMHDIYLAYAYHDVDSVTFVLPDGFRIEAIPDPVEIETDFARYRAFLNDTGEGSVHYFREMELKRSVIPVELYDEFRQFYREVVRADRAQIVAVRIR